MKRGLFGVVIILLFAMFAKEAFCTYESQVDWSAASLATGYEIGYKLGGSYSEPFDGTGLSIGNSPVDVGNVTSKIIGGIPDGTTVCVTVRPYFEDGHRGEYTTVVCHTNAQNSTTYQLWGDWENTQITLGNNIVAGYCTPLVSANGIYYQGTDSYVLSGISGIFSNVVTFERAEGDLVLYTQQSDGGTLYPVDFVVGYFGQSFDVTAIPDDGKCLTELLDNYESVIHLVQDNAYTVVNPFTNHVIIPSYGSCFSATASASAGGSITPSSAQLNYGESTTFSITENTGYYLTSLTDNGVSVIGQVYDGQYTVEYANENHAIVATFAMDYVLMKISTIGTFRAGQFFLRNENSAGASFTNFYYGAAGDIPIVGDWNGDGIDTIGIFRAGQFFLRNENSAGASFTNFYYGLPDGKPLTGSWQ